jgi:glycosyltransferase involved in cell wall biosynthesis
MQAATALVLNSRYENFPCVLPEAWSSGLPVVAPNVGGIAEGLTAELGKLIPAGDDSALVQAMVDIQSATFDPEALHRHAREFYGVEAVAQAYRDVYNSCLDD